MKASIVKLGLGVVVVVFCQSCMHYGLSVGVFVFGLGGRGTLTLRTSQLDFFLVIISPFPFSLHFLVSTFPVVSAEAPLKTRMLHRPHTSLCGNLGGALFYG